MRILKKIYDEVFYISPRNRRRLKRYVKAKAKHIYNYYVIDIIHIIAGAASVCILLICIYFAMILLAG